MGFYALAWVVFVYVPATEFTDGSPLAIEDIDVTSVYCGDYVAREDGADGDIEVYLPVGSHSCFGTHTVDGVESGPSNVVEKEVIASLSPSGFSVSE